MASCCSAPFLFVQARRQDGEPLVPFSLFRDRNYALMNIVAAFIAIGMLGIFLPFSIYLQSVLGFSALKAGLTMAPASLVSMFVAPVAGRMSDRIGGKYILMIGLLLFGGGMGSIALIAQANSAWYDFLAPQFVAGIGIGCTFAPMTTVAMRNVSPMMAGAASGVFNTTRQVGTVIGTAGVGALLQNRLTRPGSPIRSCSGGAALPAAARDKLLARLPVGGQRRPGSGLGRAHQRAGWRDLHARLRRGDAADDAVPDHLPGRGCGQLPLHQAPAAAWPGRRRAAQEISEPSATAAGDARTAAARRSSNNRARSGATLR